MISALLFEMHVKILKFVPKGTLTKFKLHLRTVGVTAQMSMLLWIHLHMNSVGIAPVSAHETGM
jgi:hypothetical protein